MLTRKKHILACTKINLWQYKVSNHLTPCSRVLEKLTVFQLVKKFPVFDRTRRFVTAFKTARHLSLSRDRQSQFTPFKPTACRCVLILFCHLTLGLICVFFLSGFTNKAHYAPGHDLWLLLQCKWGLRSSGCYATLTASYRRFGTAYLSRNVGNNYQDSGMHFSSPEYLQHVSPIYIFSIFVNCHHDWFLPLLTQFF